MNKIPRNNSYRQRTRLKTEKSSFKEDMVNLTLVEILDVQVIQSLMDNFNNLTHIPMSIIDNDGNVLVGIGWQDICTKFHRAHPKTCKNCIESDTQLTTGISNGEFKLYKCKNNMWDIATPIIVGGKKLGNLISGQFFFEDEEPDYELFRKQAQKYGFNEEEYIKALEDTPRLNMQTVNESMDFFMKFADIISQMSYNNIRLNKSLTESEQLMNSLQKSEKKYRTLADNLEEQVNKRTKELNEAVINLKRSNAELQHFAYVASHDLQEPLRTISSFTQLLERRYKDKLDKDADEFMEYIVEAAKRMQQLIKDLLEYSRVTSQEEEFKLTNTEEIIEEIISDLQITIEENNAEITYDSLPEIWADKRLLTQVFQNLIFNPIKYRKPDEPPKIHISARKDENNKYYIYSVSDNGIGIEKQYFDRIFMIFQRLHTQEAYQGTGIGLAIVKKIIDNHGGRIWVESTLGKGSTFYFTIPHCGIKKLNFI